MIVLDWCTSGASEGGRHAVALFGLGLVGSAILSSIEKRTSAHGRTMAFAWEADGPRDEQGAAIVDYLGHLLANGAKGGDLSRTTIDIVWAAGKGGFQASAAEFDGDLAAFDSVLAIATRLSVRFPDARHEFHLVSSAGGLFEGQRLVGTDSKPDPQRPYGAVKLEQERRLLALPGETAVSIYRPSSVYGYKSGGRAGLISTLVGNAINNRTTRIFGDLNTLRDYVFVQDVGRFIAGKVVENRVSPDAGGARTYLLASGKPTSMHEIVRLIESKLQRRLFLKFDAAPSNARHMSFRPSALPTDWSPTPPSFGVHFTVNEIMTEFLSPG
ncbi:MAG: NAD-dependent epimerase/dehydratase family protein [Mesorhizobium sp.]|nr:NAD-dependent epimerase/dehydratase family protein [Mesorhizobium sp.]